MTRGMASNEVSRPGAKRKRSAAGSVSKRSLERILGKYDVSDESLLPMLQEIQETFLYLPEEGLKAASRKLGLPLTRVYSVATFYNAFSLKPKGKYLIQVCTGTACHIKGAERLLSELKTHLGIGEGETTTEGTFTVESVRCLGCCSLAPVIMINGKTYGNLKPEMIGPILDEYRK